MTKLWPICAATLVVASGCAQALLGEKEYVLGDGSETSGGGAGGDSVGTSSSTGLPEQCPGPTVVCGLTCVDLSVDAENCGKCGHSCEGAACSDSLCVPSIVVSDLVDPGGMTVDAQYVFWTTGDGRIQRALKLGGSVVTLSEGQDSPKQILVDDKNVFWVNESTGEIFRQPKDGSKKAKSVSKNVGLPRIAADDMQVYFSHKLKKGDLQSVSKEGGLPKTLVSGQSKMGSLAVGGNRVFWSGFAEAVVPDETDPEPLALGGYVRALSTGGGKVVTVAAGEGEISHIAMAGDTLIWADELNATIRRLGPSDSEPVTLAEGQIVRGISGGAGVFFWSTEGGNVKVHDLVTGETRLVAVDMTGAGSLSLDKKYVYILRTAETGSIVRIAR